MAYLSQTHFYAYLNNPYHQIGQDNNFDTLKVVEFSVKTLQLHTASTWQYGVCTEYWHTVSSLVHCRTEAQDYWRIYTKGMHCARAICREECAVGGSELATTTQNMVQQRTTVPFALWQNYPKLSILVKSCSNWCKVQWYTRISAFRPKRKVFSFRLSVSAAEIKGWIWPKF